MSEEIYIGPYKVFKIFRKSRRVEVIKRGLTLDDAKKLVNSYPDSNSSMVCFCKQFNSKKYFLKNE